MSLPAGLTGWIERLLARRPAVPVAAALILGIFAHPCLPAWPGIWIALLILLLIIAILGFRKPALCSAAILLSIFFAGLSLAQIEAFFFPAHHISAFSEDRPHLVQIELKLTDPPRELTWPYGHSNPIPPKQVATAMVQRIKTWNGWVDCTGGVLLQISQPNPRLSQGQIIRVLGSLERPGPAMNPGQFNWADYYRDQRVLASVQVASAQSITILEQQPIGAIAWLREQTRRMLALGFSNSASLDHALMQALVLGDNDPELRNVQEQFRRTGTSHHLAISGMHVAVLGAVVFLFCRILRIGPRAACCVSLIFTILYGLVALPSPPVVRSIILCASVGFGLLQRRSIDFPQLLALSVVGMLIYHPLDLYTAGFQLSFGILLGLLLLAPAVLEIFPADDPDVLIAHQNQPPGAWVETKMKIWGWIRRTLAASIAAWLVAMPLIAYHFEQLNPWAIPASLILAVFVFIALIGGFAKIILTILWPSLAHFWARGATFPMVWMRNVVEWLASFPGSEVPVPAPPVWMVLLFYAFLFLWVIRWSRTWLTWCTRLVSLAGCATLATLLLRDNLLTLRAQAGELKMTLLALGAGQCAVIEPPGAEVILIDAGSASVSDLAYKVVGPFLRHEGRRQIRSIYISHANLDHFSAVADLTAAYDVHDVNVAPQFRRQSAENAAAEGLLRSLDQLDRTPRQIARGDSFDLGGGARLEVVWPTADSDYDANDTSLVLKLTFAGKSILFTGDIQNAAERDLMFLPDSIRADVLIAPHHGSDELTTASFVQTVSPQMILSSNDRTLSMKQREFDRQMSGRTVYRTHTSGSITVRINSAGQLDVDTYLRDGK